ncbi:MAG: hypothetical protein ACR2N3_12645 [Pyrinomonadaceae bacterium]
MSQKTYIARILQPFTLFTACLVIISVLAAAGCDSGELSRSQVKSLVEVSPEFVQPAIIDLTNQYETKPSNIDKLSATETVEQAKARDLKTLLESYPDMEAANYLGFTDVEQTLIKEVPYTAGSMNIPGWYLTRKIRASEKGKQLWQEIKLPIKDDSLPIGRKEFIEVSGIAKQGETMAIADFTYKWQPNELGKALDEQTDEFKKLPQEIRKRLAEKRGLLHTSDSMDWSGERQGKAIFQKYDDGWRLVKIF